MQINLNNLNKRLRLVLSSIILITHNNETLKTGEIMKKVTLTKKAKVEAPEEFKKIGVIAFQVVDFVIDYFGNKIECSHDTKILDDGRQLVIGGDGFIAEGYEVSSQSI